MFSCLFSLKIRAFVAATALALLMCACSLDQFMEKRATDPDAIFVEQFLQRFVARDFDYVKQHVNEKLRSQISNEKLIEIAEYLPEGEMLSSEIFSAWVDVFPNERYGTIIYEFEFEGGWVLATARFVEKPMRITITGFNFQKTTGPQVELNRLSLQDKFPFQYMIMLAAIVMTVFVSFTLVVCIKTRRLQHKALWLIFILFGFGQVSVNWTSGQLGYHIFSLHLFSSTILTGSRYGPWVFGVSLPLGALIFWLRFLNAGRQILLEGDDELGGRQK